MLLFGLCHILPIRTFTSDTSCGLTLRLVKTARNHIAPPVDRHTRIALD